MTEIEGVFLMCQSNFLEISRSALRRNAAAVREAVQVPIIGVVKCNGYGVTLYEAAAAWQAAGVTMFGVSRPEEALSLRKMGFREEILLLCPVVDGRTQEELLESNIILTVSSFEDAQRYAVSANRYPIRVHIAIDTGMGRLGIRWDDPAQVRAVYGLSGFSFEGIFSHFANAFEPLYWDTRRQLARFRHLTDQLEGEGYAIGIRHIANSCAALRFPETRLDAVRIGSALVGRLPVATGIKLENVSVFKAQVVARKTFHPGDTVGYGSYYKIRKFSSGVIVALGHEDGFGLTAKPDHLRFRDLIAYLRRVIRGWLHPPYVVWNHQELKILGRVGSQYTIFDATGLAVQPGDWVEWDGNLMLSHCERRFV